MSRLICAPIVLTLVVSAAGCHSAPVYQSHASAMGFAAPAPAAVAAYDVQNDPQQDAAESSLACAPRPCRPLNRADSGGREPFPASPTRVTAAAGRTSLDERIQLHLAAALAHSGRFDESLSQFTGVIGPAAACLEIGVICYGHGDISRSRHFFEQAQACDAELTDARVWLRWVEIQDQSATPATAIARRQP